MRYILLAAILFSLFPTAFLKAQNTDESNARVKCKVGIYIKTLQIKQTEETFDAVFYWWLRVDSIDITKDYTFVKSIEFINGDAASEVIEERIDSVNKYYFVNGTCKATFPYKADFKQFPYDKQILNIAIENTTTNVDNMVYVPDNQNLFINKLSDKNIDILNGGQFSISKLDFKSSVYTYQTNFGDPAIKGFDKYSRLNFSIAITHDSFEVLQKIALPLLVVLILAYLVFFIPDYEIGTASALTVTALLAAIAFQWTINDSLPKVSYITLIDKIFYLVYFFIFYAMTQTVVTFNMSKGSEKVQKLSDKIEWHSRYLFPLTFVILFCILIKNAE